MSDKKDYTQIMQERLIAYESVMKTQEELIKLLKERIKVLEEEISNNNLVHER